MKAFYAIVMAAFVANHSARAATPAVSFEVAYSEVADSFDIMDNVSNWWPGFCEGEYRNYWEQKYPVSEQDQRLFEAYRAIRQKYYNDPDQAERDPSKNRNGVFAHQTILTSDPIAEAFYGAKSWDDAFNKVGKIVTPGDHQTLKEFFPAFQDKLKPLLGESKAFVKVASAVQKKVSTAAANSYFSKVARFYGSSSSSSMKYRILYTWWPPIDRTNATPTGQFLIMRYHPVRHIKDAEADVEIAFHEVVHAISAMQPYDKKQALTKVFLEQCPVQERLQKKFIVEEPLAVVIGQAIYTKRQDPKKFSFSDNWYNERWTNLFAKLIYPTVSERFDKDGILDDALMTELGKLCNDAVDSATKLK